jgi:RHS repeat-associated protein
MTSGPISIPGRAGLCCPRLLLGLILAGAAYPIQARADVASGVSDERVSLPDGPGSVGGLGSDVSVNPSMGAMSYSVSVLTPGGFPGLTPSLDISYSSTAGSGLVGIGWSMMSPSIGRMTSRGLPTYTDEDRFAADGGDELVRTSNTATDATYRARFEKGFVRYTWHGVGAAGYWTAEHPDGRKSFYGAKPDGTLVDTAQVKTAAGGVFRYLLTSTLDPFGNELRYRYTKGVGGYPLLDEINYLFNDDGTAHVSVRFSYESRDDLISDGSPGFELVLDKRLKEVRVMSDSTQIRRATLTYEASAKSGGSSRLASIEQFGLDDAPDPLHFTFAYSQALGGNCSSASCGKPLVVDMGTLPGNVLLNAGKATMIDINGDSLPDVLSTDPATGKHTFYRSVLGADGKPGFDMTPVNSDQGSSSLVLGLPAVQVMDLNGDGFTDIVNAKTRDFRCNDGSGDWSASKFCVGGSGAGDMFSDSFTPADDPNDTGQDPLHVRFFDFDHDRKIDWLRTESQGSTVVSRNTGSGFEAVTVEAIGEVFDEGPLQLADINGDGLQDPVMLLSTGAVRYRINLGRGSWTDWRQVSLGLDPTQIGGAHIEDLNGDGLADIVVVLGNEVRYYLNRNGEKFDASVVVTSAGVDGGIPSFDPKTTSVSFADMNGNGSTDIVWVTNTGNVKFLELFPVRPNLLTRIENGIGHVQVIGYGTSVAERSRDASAGSPWKYSLPHSMNVVTSLDQWVSLTGSDSGGIHELTRYRYGSGYYDGKEAQFRGYEQVESERPSEGSMDTQDPSLAVLTTDVGATDAYRHGLPLRSSQYSLAGGAKKLLLETRKEYEDCSLGEVPASGLSAPIRFLCETGTTSVVVEGDPSSAVTTRSERTYDEYGNVSVDRALGVVHRGTPESPLPCGACPSGTMAFGEPCGPQCLGDERYTETKYVVPGKDTSGAWQLGKAWRVVDYGVAGGPQHETLTYFDGEAFAGLPQGTLSKGFVSRVRRRRGSGADDFIELTRAKGDAHGNVIESIDPLGAVADMSGHRTVYTMDARGHKVIRAEKLLTAPSGAAYRLRRDVTYDGTWDKISEGTAWMLVEGDTAVSPRNSKKYRYDALGRMARMLEPGDQEEAPTREAIYQFGSTTVAISALVRSATGGPQDVESIQCLDGRGRQFQARDRVAPGKYQVSGFVERNAKGNPVRQFEPYLSDSAACDLAPPDQVKFTTFRYDALDRLVQSTFADGSSALFEHRPLMTVQYDEEMHDTIIARDGLGRATSVARHLDASSPTVTTLEYDSLGRLTAYVDPAGHRHEQAYDGLDRVVEVNDVDVGKVLMEYDAAGNEIRRTDARGVSLRKEFDGDNRLRKVWDESDEAGSAMSATYDKLTGCADCTNVVGRLARTEYPLGKDALTPTGARQVGYDTRGNTVFEASQIEGHEFVVRHAIDNEGRKLQTTYPDGQVVSWQHDASSRVVAMPGVLSSITYGSRGEQAGIAYASGASVSKGYDARTRLQSMTTKAASGAVLYGVELTRGPSGNITAIEDKADARVGRPSQKLSVTHDAWYRVIEASIDAGGAQAEKLSYAYDTTERVLSATSSLGAASPAHVGSYTYSPDKPLAVQAAGSISYSYGASGLMTSRAGLAYERDAYGRLTRVTESGALREAVAYGWTGERVLRLQEGGAAYVIGPDFEVRDGVTVLYPRLEGTRVARRMSTSLAAAVLSDLSPAADQGGTLAPTGDGVIDAGDVWIAEAAALGVVKLAASTSPSPVSRLLRASARRLLLDDSPAVVSLVQDHQGSTTLSLDEKGDLVAERAFYPFGEARGAEAFVDRSGFTGQEHDESTGLVHFKFRAYDPHSGRWSEADPGFLRVQSETMATSPLADTTSGYAYVGNGPVSRIDPLGLMLRAAVGVGRMAVSQAARGGGHAARPAMAGVRHASFYAGGEVANSAAVRHAEQHRETVIDHHPRFSETARESSARLKAGKEWAAPGGSEELWRALSIDNAKAVRPDEPIHIFLGPGVNSDGTRTSNGTTTILKQDEVPALLERGFETATVHRVDNAGKETHSFTLPLKDVFGRQ